VPEARPLAIDGKQEGFCLWVEGGMSLNGISFMRILSSRTPNGLTQDSLDHMPMHVGQPIPSSLMSIG
jgi:hypothetical protein